MRGCLSHVRIRHGYFLIHPYLYIFLYILYNLINIYIDVN
nr:MAG TPA: hypothetical protein [Caudoviricetes sp.]